MTCKICTCTTNSDSTSYHHHKDCGVWKVGKIMICDCPTQSDKEFSIHDPKCRLIREKTPKFVSEAARQPVNYRYDILDSAFLHLMAEIAHYGAEKYGDYNYKESRLAGGKSPINHMYMHLHQYKQGIVHDKYGDLSHQLAAIAFNAMMEFYYLDNSQKNEAFQKGEK